MSFKVKGDWVDWEHITLEELKTHIRIGSLTTVKLFPLYFADRFKGKVAEWVRSYLEENKKEVTDHYKLAERYKIPAPKKTDWKID